MSVHEPSAAAAAVATTDQLTRLRRVLSLPETAQLSAVLEETFFQIIIMEVELKQLHDTVKAKLRELLLDRKKLHHRITGRLGNVVNKLAPV